MLQHPQHPRFPGPCIRPILEYACPAWHPGITQTQSDQIERVQKRALRIILANRYDSYARALERTGIPTLSSRREDLCLRFARSALKSSQWNYWFTPNDQSRTLRNIRLCKEPKCRTERFKRSPIPYFTKQLNQFGLWYCLKAFNSPTWIRFLIVTITTHKTFKLYNVTHINISK